MDRESDDRVDDSTLAPGPSSWVMFRVGSCVVVVRCRVEHQLPMSHLLHFHFLTLF